MTTLTRWHKVHPEAVTRVSRRLSATQSDPPFRAARLCGFGWIHESRGLAVLRIEVEYRCGISLHFSELFRNHSQNIRALLQQLGQRWAEQGFVHGDLSLRNLLYCDATNELSAIDWALDPQSPSGTPAFSSPEILITGHTVETDAYSLRKILERFNPGLI